MLPWEVRREQTVRPREYKTSGFPKSVTVNVGLNAKVILYFPHQSIDFV